jgi:hypothetical protein
MWTDTVEEEEWKELKNYCKSYRDQANNNNKIKIKATRYTANNNQLMLIELSQYHNCTCLNELWNFNIKNKLCNYKIGLSEIYNEQLTNLTQI